MSKLGNLVVDGGIWMNTQRPEWNDANNALVGQGLSMVTLYYLRRYVRFLDNLLSGERDEFELSGDVATWLAESATALARFRPILADGRVSAADRLALLTELGEAASAYRAKVYASGRLSGVASVTLEELHSLLADTLAAIDASIASNRRDDGLYQAYNLMSQSADGIRVDTLYPMLEGQVAALSAGAVAPDVAIDVLESLFESPVYRPDQDSFMLYPDRKLPSFLEKNRIAPNEVEAIPLLVRLLAEGNEQVILRDEDGAYRFSAEFTNVGDLECELAGLPDVYADDVAASRDALHKLFEQVFDHQSFTGRSGTMFGFEGLGCVYWHMVSKLLVAVQENFFAAALAEADAKTVHRLGELYYRVREGLGFNKTPLEYGAFPTDPYSHTTGHSGARQPGMTGQVKEEILTRFGELGVRVNNGAISFAPGLLRHREFIAGPGTYRQLTVGGSWQDIEIPAHGLAFSFCQVAVVYTLADDDRAEIVVSFDDGSEQLVESLDLPADVSREMFDRSGQVRQLKVSFGRDLLFSG